MARIDCNMKFKWQLMSALVVFMISLATLGNATPANKPFPVLPFPQHHTQANTKLSFASFADLKDVRLPATIKENLWWHWQQFKQEHPAASAKNTAVKIGLLGNDASFDHEVEQLCSPWLSKLGKEGYVLVLNNSQQFIAAYSEAGLFYGLQTLKQLLRAGWNTELMIADWPSLPYRMIYDDISRGPISTVEYIRKQIERMAEIKINSLSFYIEHIVQTVSYPDFAPADGKLTISQIKELSAYAKKFHMDLVGSFQSFGHFEKILSLPQYASMGATSTLISPASEQAKKFLESVVGELCDAFGSPYFNVNCDETFDLGQGNTKNEVARIGPAAFYANHLKFLYDIVRRHGKKMMMWGDFALQHEEVLDLLPKDITYLTWEYGDQSSYDHWIKPFADRGLSYMVCPGILNSYRMFPDMLMAKANISGFVNAGFKQGTKGAITTIWDDGGTYLFSADWYGVYVAAEKSWISDTSGDTSFDSRFEQNAYGTSNGNYVKALFKLMELRKLPLTYNLNDRLWQQKLLPDSSKKLILNNTSADAALKILDQANAFIKAASPGSNKDDINTLKFSIDQYRLMIESRTKIAAIATDYQRMTSTNSKEDANTFFAKSQPTLKSLIKQYAELKERFRQAWIKENQPYWLDVILASYDKKINDLKGLEASLDQSSKAGPLPAPATIRLSIEESANFYFPNWMLTGAFPASVEENFPAFLYSDISEYNKPPSPGDFTQYKGKMYRWRKFASSDGGMVYLDETYTQKDPAFVYAYCSLTASADTSVQAFISTSMPVAVFCNGVQMQANTSGNDLSKTNLVLKPGVNHILLKLKKTNGTDNGFSFRLQDNNITNHKHKYQLNAKKESYDAE